MTLVLLIISATLFGAITGALAARRSDLMSLAISLGALLTLVLLARSVSGVP
jgi:hypothetical protein